MKSSGEIHIDFQNAMRQAQRLEDLADDVDRRVVHRLDAAAQGVHAAWRGGSAGRYIGKSQELCRQVRQSSRTLREAAGDIRRIAWSIYEAEMRALEIARKRDS